MISSNGWISHKALLAGVAVLLFVHPSCYADNLRIGVAANFRATLEEIASRFTKTHHIPVDLSAASTGALFAQASNGAPFDILFTADSRRPRLLESGGHTRDRQTYAYGQLVFWTPGRPADEQALKGFEGTISIANPRHAPYGEAAMDTLDRLQVKPGRVVHGTNIAQAFNFVRSGNATAGLVALSQVRQLAIPASEYWIVPPKYYTPIEQQLVILKRASTEAELFIEFTYSTATASLIEQSGYLLPHPKPETGVGTSNRPGDAP